MLVQNSFSFFPFVHRDTYVHKRTIEKPENMSGVSEFKPSKIAVDTSDRIYIVVQSSLFPISRSTFFP